MWNSCERRRWLVVNDRWSLNAGDRLSRFDSYVIVIIEEVCKDVEKTINQTIQNTLNSLEKDCKQIVQLIDQKMTKDRSVGLYVTLSK